MNEVDRIGLRRTVSGPAAARQPPRLLARTYHGLVSWLRLRALGVPTVLVDVTLAGILGLVGAAQLDRNTPFDQLDRRPRNPFGPGAGNPGNGGLNAASGLGGPDTLTYVLLGLCAASLIVRSRLPLLSLAGVTLFGAAYLETGQPVFAVQLIVLVAVYSAVADSGLPRGLAVLVSLASGLVLAAAIWQSDLPRTDAQWAIDAASYHRTCHLPGRLGAQPARNRSSEAEKSREEEARRRVSEEPPANRTRVARRGRARRISLDQRAGGAGSHVLYREPEQAQRNLRQHPQRQP